MEGKNSFESVKTYYLLIFIGSEEYSDLKLSSKFDNRNRK